MPNITAARATSLKEEELLLSFEEESITSLGRQREVAQHNRRTHKARRELRQDKKKQRMMVA